MPLPSKVQDTLARSLNNLTVVSDTALEELAQTVPTRQADKLQLLLNKLLERAELEASSSQAASSSGANLGPDSSSAPALDVVRTLEALDAAGGGLANDDIEQLAADPAPSLSPWPAQAPADASASGSGPPPGLQSYDPAALGGHDQSANLGAPTLGLVGAQRSLGKLTWAPLLRPSLRELHQQPLQRLAQASTLRVSHPP